MIIELAGILDQQTCDEIIEFYEGHSELCERNDAQEMFNHCSMKVDQVEGELAIKLEALKGRLLIKAAKFYNLEEIYLDYWSIVKWSPGKSMVFHADNVTESRDPHHYCWWRDYSAVVYLNHSFSGGETVFKYQNQRSVPTKGSACMFPASFGYTHGVSEVTAGNRYTLAIWMTKVPEQALIR